jgi:hypothetical protein
MNIVGLELWHLYQSVLLMEETGVSGKTTNHRQILSHNVVLSTHRHEQDSNSQRYPG